MPYAALARIIALAGAVAAASAAPQPEPPHVSEVLLADAISGKRVTLVLVKDFMKVQNSGGLLQNVEFPRYAPVVDDEQVVLGRWIEARMSGGTVLPSDCSRVKEDEAGNLIQTVHIHPFPAHHIVSVTITTVVARREPARPTGEIPIPAPEQYPADVRPYLASTPMVDTRNQIVQRTAKEALAKTHDAAGVAAEIVRLASARSYLPAEGFDGTLPLSGAVLKSGGSCCASAVAAAAVFRACGIPAQVTYCPPPSFVHGIVQFYAPGHGWVRLDATSGSGRFPLVQDEGDLGLVRVFNMPIQMEQQPGAYAWPYQNNDADGQYTFFAEGQPSDQLQMYVSPSGLPFVKEPFSHLEPGSWNTVLGSEPLAGGFTDWAALTMASRSAIKAGTLGPFSPLVEALPATKPYLDAAATWCMSPPDQVPEVPRQIGVAATPE